MNYEALGRYTAAKRTALESYANRSKALFDLKRWADSASAMTSHELVTLDTDTGARLLTKVAIYNDAFNAALIDANSVHDAASEARLDVRVGHFTP